MMHPTAADMTEAVRALGTARVARQKEWWLPETSEKRKQELQLAVDLARMHVEWVADRVILTEAEAAEEAARKAAAEAAKAAPSES